MSWTPDSIPDQAGRLAVVTGANSGIGYVTARELARRCAHVVLACRSHERGRNAVERLRTEVPDAHTELRMLDLADLKSIRNLAEGWSHGRLDLLVNNAGVTMVPFSRTADGFESQFGINHLGTFALTATAPGAAYTGSSRACSCASLSAHARRRQDLPVRLNRPQPARRELRRARRVIPARWGARPPQPGTHHPGLRHGTPIVGALGTAHRCALLIARRTAFSKMSNCGSQQAGCPHLAAPDIWPDTTTYNTGPEARSPPSPTTAGTAAHGPRRSTPTRGPQEAAPPRHPHSGPYPAPRDLGLLARRSLLRPRHSSGQREDQHGPDTPMAA
ncbi:SDR family NAD(P)-dependent oxidoreductase [Streptomyces sp. ME19-01-6]|nr:SDR family NAD(P)-dependent oxidoreductase [Streptomyces sp. ME19-01-6]MDX3233167.1 SDR family NAD(P)-dependent oxidoreductase [Streptomyces sp. ME19-01-6]